MKKIILIPLMSLLFITSSFAQCENVAKYTYEHKKYASIIRQHLDYYPENTGEIAARKTSKGGIHGIMHTFRAALNTYRSISSANPAQCAAYEHAMDSYIDQLENLLEGKDLTSVQQKTTAASLPVAPQQDSNNLSVSLTAIPDFTPSSRIEQSPSFPEDKNASNILSTSLETTSHQIEQQDTAEKCPSTLSGGVSLALASNMNKALNSGDNNLSSRMGSISINGYDFYADLSKATSVSELYGLARWVNNSLLNSQLQDSEGNTLCTYHDSNSPNNTVTIKTRWNKTPVMDIGTCPIKLGFNTINSLKKGIQTAQGDITLYTDTPIPNYDSRFMSTAKLKKAVKQDNNKYACTYGYMLVTYKEFTVTAIKG